MKPNLSETARCIRGRFSSRRRGGVAFLTLALSLGCARRGYDLTLLEGTGSQGSSGNTASRSRSTTGANSNTVNHGMTASAPDATAASYDLVTDAASPLAPSLCSYSAPERLTEPNSPGNQLSSPTLSNNGLTMYLAVIVPTVAEQIGIAIRPDRGLSFGQANTVPPPLTVGITGTPHLVAHGLSLYFYSNRPSSLGGRDLYLATRTDTDADFNVVTNLNALNSPSVEHNPWVSNDERRIYFVSERDGGDEDIWQSSRTSISDAFDPPTRVSELNSPAQEGRTTFPQDELVVVFASNRAGGVGNYDLYHSSRTTTDEPFSPPVLMPEVNSAAPDLDPALTTDGAELFFTSNRNGEIELWRSLRTCF